MIIPEVHADDLGAKGYRLEDKIIEGVRFVIYRACRNGEQEPYLIKILRPRFNTPEAAERLHQEMRLLETLGTEAVLKPVDFHQSPARTFAVFGPFEGSPLETVLSSGKLQLPAFLDLTIAITSAVAEIQRHGIVHGNLQPTKILIGPGPGARILDFEFALSNTNPPANSRASLPVEAAPAYASPEHIRRGEEIDNRSDLYSLGVLFYEMLTGKLPFVGEDPLEWQHLHVARLPTPPVEIDPDIPEILSASVMKLLAKAPEDRYQSAHGLRQDLMESQRRLREEGAVSPFPLARQDLQETLRFPRRLFGREPHLARLRESFREVIQEGSPRVATVFGGSGIGKSVLVGGIVGDIKEAGGLFLSGKVDQNKRGIPYATIAEAFRGLIRRLLALPEVEVDQWRELIGSAVGANGKVLAEVIPELEWLIGEQPEVAELPPAEARSRFTMVFERFFHAVAEPERPMVLFLDDMQWADPGTLDLAARLTATIPPRPLHLILAYRDNEVDETHPLLNTIAGIREKEVAVDEVEVGPLQEADVERWIRVMTNRSAEDCRRFSRLLLRKTEGNPFFVLQFLRTLHGEKLIRFDHDRRQWEWDEEGVARQHLAPNVADLVVRRMQALPPLMQELLKTASCLGNHFDLRKLAALQARSLEEAREAISHCVTDGEVGPVPQSEETEEASVTYRFLHDRIQQAAYSLMNDAERRERHLAIGRFLAKEAESTESEEQLFDAATHLAKAAAAIDSSDERLDAARLLARAGRRAKRSTAWEGALDYFLQAIDLLPAEIWKTDHQLAFTLHLDRAECESLAGNFEAADACFQDLLGNARDNVERATVHTLRLRLFQLAGIFSEAMQVFKQGIRLFGIDFPDDPTELEETTAREKRRMDERLRGISVPELIDLPPMKDPEARAAMALMTNAAPCSYLGMPETFPLLTLQMAKLSIERGNSEESAFGYSAYGMMLIAVWGDIATGYQFSEMATRLCERVDDLRYSGKVFHAHGHHVHYWKKPYHKTLPIVERGFQASVAAGDIGFANFSGVFTTWIHFEMGGSLSQAIAASRRFEEFALETGVDTSLHALRGERHLFRVLAGPPAADESTDPAYDESRALAVYEERNFATGFFFHSVGKMILHYHDGEIAEALEAAEKAIALQDSARVLTIEVTLCVYHALILAAVSEKKPQAERAETIRAIEQRVEQLEKWTLHCPENFEHKRLLVATELARLRGDPSAALGGYETAGKAALRQGDYQTAGLAFEAGGRYFRAGGATLAATAMLEAARDAYLHWGARGKVQRLATHFPDLPLSDTPPAGMEAHSLNGAQLDALAVVKASQAISRELRFSSLPEALIEIVLEYAGATRGILLLEKDGVLEPKADVNANREDRLPAGAPYPVGPVNLVRRTRETLVLSGPPYADPFSDEPYLRGTSPRSVLCLPLSWQGNRRGVLYLENRLAQGLFTPGRVVMLEALATQAAISLENARLFGEAQDAIRSRDRAIEYIRSFSYSISHDLRAPLRAVSTYASLLAEDHAHSLNTEGRDFVRRIRDSGRRMDRMLQDLLKYIGIHQGPKDLETIDIEAIITIATENDPALAAGGLHVVVPYPLELVRGNESLLIQTVANLLGNAVKYAAPGKRPEVNVHSERVDGKVRVWFEDNGVGIAPQFHERIFRLFERLDAQKDNGTGIGLAIVRNSIEAMGGHCGVESKVGRGSRFWIELPAAEEPR